MHIGPSALSCKCSGYPLVHFLDAEDSGYLRRHGCLQHAAHDAAKALSIRQGSVVGLTSGTVFLSPQTPNLQGKACSHVRKTMSSQYCLPLLQLCQLQNGPSMEGSSSKLNGATDGGMWPHLVTWGSSRCCSGVA